VGWGIRQSRGRGAEPPALLAVIGGKGITTLPVNPPTEPSASQTQTRILLVDDSTAAREHVRGALAKAMAIHFSEASDGQEALWKAKLTPHDLVITDMHMPTMDGLALMRQLRQLPGYATVPILVVSSDLSRERIKEGRQAGATGWLVKPPKPDALVLAVRHALVNRR
jgi:two-component system, chemotaxis family, chemotaxis protein CheY